MMHNHRNHSELVGNPIEITRARHSAAKFVGLTIQADSAARVDMSSDLAGRERRNIFGSILGGLTGLVTHEELVVQQSRQIDLEKKISHALEQEVYLDGQLDKLVQGFEGFEDKVLREIANMKMMFGAEDLYRAKQGGSNAGEQITRLTSQITGRWGAQTSKY
jgi:hypothetical protein